MVRSDWRDPASWDDRVDRTVVPRALVLRAAAAGPDREHAHQVRLSLENTELRGADDFSGSPSDPTPSPTVGAGTLLKGRFVLEERLGSGGMGTVFKARDIRREEARDYQPYVAIKVLNDDFRRHPESLIALQREARKTQNLSHPNIITVFDFDRDGSTVFMSMELLEGQSLDAVIRQRPEGMPFQDAWPIIEGMGSALAYAHAQNVIHADVKPSNVYITSAGEIKVFDFSIASAIAIAKGSRDTTLFDPHDLGALTPAYASRERWEGLRPTPSDDIFSFALVSYELLTGTRPYGKNDPWRSDEVPMPVRGLDRRQWRALRSGLAQNRSQRPSEVSQVLALLKPKPWYRSFI